jgi:hypothetical protein
MGGMSRYCCQVLSGNRRMTAPLSQLNMKTCAMPGAVEDV